MNEGRMRANNDQHSFAECSRTKNWRRGELNFFRLLKPRKLLILRSARNAKIAQNA